MLNCALDATREATYSMFDGSRVDAGCCFSLGASKTVRRGNCDEVRKDGVEVHGVGCGLRKLQCGDHFLQCGADGVVLLELLPLLR